MHDRRRRAYWKRFKHLEEDLGELLDRRRQLDGRDDATARWLQPRMDQQIRLIRAEHDVLNDSWDFRAKDIARAIMQQPAGVLVGDAAARIMLGKLWPRIELLRLLAPRWPYTGGVQGSLPSLVHSGEIRTLARHAGPIAADMDDDAWMTVIVRGIDELLYLYRRLDDVSEEDEAMRLVITSVGGGKRLERVLAAWRHHRRVIDARRAAEARRTLRAARARAAAESAAAKTAPGPTPEERRRLESIDAIAREYGPRVPADTLVHLSAGPRPKIGGHAWRAFIVAWSRQERRLGQHVIRDGGSPSSGNSRVLYWLTTGRERDAVAAVARLPKRTARRILDQLCRAATGSFDIFGGWSRLIHQRSIQWRWRLRCAWAARARLEGVRRPGGRVPALADSVTTDDRGYRLIPRRTIIAAFRRAERELGAFWRVTGPHHHPRASLPPNIARYAAQGVTCHVRLRRSARDAAPYTFLLDGFGEQRPNFNVTLFAYPIVQRAAELLGFNARDWPAARLAPQFTLTTTGASR